mgnify:CR=1 FL=1
MKNKIRMIGMDLDGTLLKTNKELTAYTKDVLKRAAEQGIIVMPATGRPFFRHSERADQAAGNPLCSYCKWSKSHRYEEK